MALTDKLTAIADAVRAKTGGTELMTLDQMAAAISEISGGNVLIIGNESLHDSSTDTADIYLEAGVEKSYSGWSATDYIPIKKDTVYAVQNQAYKIDGPYCALYDSDKKYKENFVGGFQNVTVGIGLFIGSGGYVRFSGTSNSISALSVFECTGGFKFASEQSEAAILSDDIPAEVALDILTGGGPAE